MPELLRQPVARFVAVTALFGSLADWVLFASLVVTVDDRLGGTAWATAAVLLARVLPAMLFAPVAARRMDRRRSVGLRSLLVGHEALRIASVVVIVLVRDLPLVAVLVALVVLEFAAAMLASGRESLISRQVPATLHTGVNTVTAVASYGLLPIGAVVVQLVGPVAGLLVASAGYAAVLASYVLRWPTMAQTGVVPVTTAIGSSVADTGTGLDGAMLRTVAAAGLGLTPLVAIFTVAPRLAESWFGDPTATAGPMAVLLAGGAVGFLLANRGTGERPGLLVAAAGLAIAAIGPWWLGLGMVGVGAGAAYLALQTRLQAEARDPGQFAAAFAVLKAATIVGTLAGPLLWQAGGRTSLLLTGAATSVGALAVLAPVGTAIRSGLRVLVRAATLRVIVVDEVGERRSGGAVVVSNHPNALDGVVAVAADPSLRPIARWQPHPVARAGFWLANAVITTAGTDRGPRAAFDDAAQVLRDGERIWLAPEGGAHTERVLRQPRSGAVRLATQAAVPIQILGIRHHPDPAGPTLRSWRPWRRPRVTLVWGDVIHPSGAPRLDTDRMMLALAEAAEMHWPGLAVERDEAGGRTFAA